MEGAMELWQGGPLFYQAAHFPLTTDCVLLSDFVSAAGRKRGIDLGCASAAISLLLLSKAPRLHMTGLEILPEAVAVAEKNMQINALQDRSAMIQGDLREHRSLFKAGSFDLVVSNPPYFPVERGKLSPSEGRAGARGESLCSMEDICQAARYLLCTGGSFYLVHKPERLSELFCAMSSCGIEPKRLRLVTARPGAAPSLVLVEGRRQGKPGLKILPELCLKDEQGNDSKEYIEIYHRQF